MSAHTCWMSSVTLLLTCCCSAFALEEANIQRYLERPIIGSETTLAEVQRYTERGVPRSG